jgi:molybdopterin/thiamine biosynthesis adenylyltransferase
MIPWFLTDFERLKRERDGITALQSQSKDWLLGAIWLLDEGGICLDAVIRAHGIDYEVRVSFPPLFPDAPIFVRTRNLEHRISTHQYGGANGTLCLEWGPDNWHPDISAVQMLESTHRLFEIENNIGRDEQTPAVIAPSRHKLTIGQELRGDRTRWYYGAPLAEFMSAQPPLATGSFKFSYRMLESGSVILIHETAILDGAKWNDKTVPTDLPDGDSICQYSGVWFRTELDPTEIGTPENLDSLRGMLAGMNAEVLLATDGTSPVAGFQRTMAAVLLLDKALEPYLFLVTYNNTVARISTVRSATATDARAPSSAVLDSKSVGIVGMGSVGSKIALSLARMGLTKFYIVDHDLFLPENIARHALNWQAVARHKVDAMATAIHHVQPGATVEVCRLHLTGQESNAVVSGALKHLSECDLIIDATAELRVFNLLAAVARRASRPIVWMEVFGGGIGGLIARSRPGADPQPHDLRNAYLQYCTDHPAQSPLVRAHDYSAEAADGSVIEASDAEVSVIADHAVRFAIDCLIPSEELRFPHSMYLIGLLRAWVFEAPFDTIPISPQAPPISQEVPAESDNMDPEHVAFLLELIKKKSDATSPAT